MKKEKNLKLVCAVQILAGVFMIFTGLRKLNYFGEGIFDSISLTEILAFVQLVAGPAFFILAYRTVKMIR